MKTRTHTHTIKQGSQATGLKTSKLALSKYVWILLLVIKKMNVFVNQIIYRFFWKVVTNWLLKTANHWMSCLLLEGNNNVKWEHAVHSQLRFLGAHKLGSYLSPPASHFNTLNITFFMKTEFSLSCLLTELLLMHCHSKPVRNTVFFSLLPMCKVTLTNCTY